MKNIFLLPLFLVCFFTLEVNAQTKTIDGIKYRVTSKENRTVEVTKTKIKGNITIPSTVTIGDDEYTVTRIGEYAFGSEEHSCLGLTSITIPNSIVTIGKYAFRKAFCPNSHLSPIVIPNSVTTIEAHAFERCYCPVIVPNSVTRIGEKVFYSCRKVNYSLPENIKIINSNAFSYSSNNLIFSGGFIHGSAFDSCDEITLTIPNSVSRIEKDAFLGFGFNVLNINIPNSVTYIGERAFAGSKLTDITLPASLDSIGTSAFSCSYLRNVIILGPTTIKDFAFSSCEKLTEVKMSPSVNMIGYSTFSSCGNLKKVSLIGNTISKNTTQIKNGTFGGCKALTSIAIPYSVKYIEKEAFEGCHSIKEIKGLNSTIKYDKYIFNNIELISAIEKTFSYSAFEKIYKELTEWQSKKEFETTIQWKERVTEEGRKKKIKQLTEEAKADYIAKYSPTIPRGILDSYDADYNTYAVTFGEAGKQYIKVPLNDAPQVKTSWSKAIINPAWGVKDDKLAVVELNVKIGNKTYFSFQKVKDNETTELALNLSPLELDFTPKQDKVPASKENMQAIDHTIDLQIPITSASNPKTFAVIIGNENYQRVSKVPYALNDAKVFADYCQKTLGIATNNIRSYTDATYGTMLSAINDIKNIAKAYNGDIHIIFYYAGHGIPNETDKNPFLLPIDADGTQSEVCYGVNRLYKELGALQAKSVIIFMDACFSGAQRGEGMLASARGVALKAKEETPQGNMVVFSAANGNETAFPYKEKGHGMFTYFLLKKLQETKGNITLYELGKYISTNVQQQSITINRKSQTPTIIPSINMGENWKTMKLTRNP